MNDLSTTDLRNHLAEGMQALLDDLTEIKSWPDFERRFLLGEGKSPNTTAAYLTGCRQFYEFTGGLHPMQAATPAWIEQWYDSLTGDLDTKHLRIAGLKFMYRRISERVPFFQNPFDIMPELLAQKLNRSKKDESERDSLTEKEYKALLNFLRSDKSVRGLSLYSIMRFGVTSGMRSAELVGLQWSNIAKTESGYSATFTGKGSKVRTIQLEVEAVKAVRRAFRARWGRAPQPSDYVFNSLTGEGMSRQTLWNWIKGIAEDGKAAGIIRQNLHVSPHVLRHTCATRLLAAGVDIYTVSRHLGHADISTTAIYLHTAQDLTEAFQRMSA